MAYVAKIAMPGFDVNTATPEQCSIHSGYPPLKAKVDQSPPHIATVVVDFTATVPQNVVNTVYQIPHGYEYLPLTFSNIEFSDPSIAPATVNGMGSAGVGSTLDIKAYCDSTYFYITIYDEFLWTSSSSVLQVSYFIFAENGS